MGRPPSSARFNLSALAPRALRRRGEYVYTSIYRRLCTTSRLQSAKRTADSSPAVHCGGEIVE